jgi:hypothetical protein
VVNPDGSITPIPPAGVTGVVNITVTTPGGTTALDSADEFTFLPERPTTGRQAAGDSSARPPSIGRSA